MLASLLSCLVLNECSQQSDTVSVLPSIAGYVRFHSIQQRLDRLEKGMQDVEATPNPLVAVFLACFPGGRVVKGDVIASKAHDDPMELELDGMEAGGQTSAW